MVALVIMGVVAFRVPPLLAPHELALGPVLYGLMLIALPGVAAIAGFTAAARVRVRPWAAFGLVRTTRWWIAVAAAAGLLGSLVSGAVSAVLGAGPVAGAGAVPVPAALLLLVVVLPLGQELLFRGIVTTVLLRYGATVGVLGSALVFAAAHGPVPAAGTALILGLVTAELRRRSGSLWPAVSAHAVHNLALTALLPASLGAA
ncbi:hypothetical protein C8E95_2108 [Pseudonocardia autotrophica]|uniref:CAAX amino terminal protease self-immunity n=2 Tax=Pseudonocardia TaxID=1847 RepID=A0A1Y2MML2_PSEAH|nr:CAAX amino terminal protease self- immunity [Pseudonocardia autotrophica]TDN73037.1 hypothetical protein C8E95_2108 [Pseudonocardia autotrophica]GEC26637.1 hypothetical protein PSA01_36660 [Pseudonocardia saturnea]